MATEKRRIKGCEGKRVELQLQTLFPFESRKVLVFFCSGPAGLHAITDRHNNNKANFTGKRAATLKRGGRVTGGGRARNSGKRVKGGSLRGGTLAEGLQRERETAGKSTFNRCERARRYVRGWKCLKGTVHKQFFYNPSFHWPPRPTVTNCSHPRSHNGEGKNSKQPPTQWKLAAENSTRLNLYSRGGGVVLLCRVTHTNTQHKQSDTVHGRVGGHSQASAAGRWGPTQGCAVKRKKKQTQQQQYNRTK